MYLSKVCPSFQVHYSLITKTQRISRELRGLREWGAKKILDAPHSRNQRNSRLILCVFVVISRHICSFPEQIVFKPEASQVCDSFQRSGFLKQVACARNNYQFVRRPQLGCGLLIQFNNSFVVLSDDQQRRRSDELERWSSQIRSSTTGNDGFDDLRESCRGNESGRGAGACPKITDMLRFGTGPCADPAGCVFQALRKQIDIES